MHAFSYLVRHMRISVVLLLVVFAAAMAAITLGNQLLPEQREPLRVGEENFDPALAKIDTLDKAELAIRSALPTNASQAVTADAIEHFVEHRFVHDVGFVKRRENWIAWLSGKLIWRNLAFATLPDDMLKTRKGICSQQAMLFQALLARFGIEYSTVGISPPQHMLVGAKIDGRWAVYDSDQEPNRDRTVFFEEMANPALLRKLYTGKRQDPKVAERIDLGSRRAASAEAGQFEMKWINENPAPQATLYHKVTKLMSKYGWLLIAFVAALSILFELKRQPLVWRHHRWLVNK